MNTQTVKIGELFLDVDYEIRYSDPSVGDFTDEIDIISVYLGEDDIIGIISKNAKEQIIEQLSE